MRSIQRHLPDLLMTIFLIWMTSVTPASAVNDDADADGDVDGLDLVSFINDTAPDSLLEYLSGFALNFGKTDIETPNNAFSFVVFGDLNGGGCGRNDRVNRLVQRISGNEGDAAFYMSTGDVIDGYWNSEHQTTCFACDPALIDPQADCAEGIPNGNMAQILAPLKDRQPVQGLVSSFFMAIGNHDDNWGSSWYPDPCGQGICEFLAPLGPEDFINRPVDAAAICQLNQSESAFSASFYYSFTFRNSYFIVLRQNSDYAGMLSCNQHPGADDCATYCSDPVLIDDPARNNYCYNVAQYDWLRDELQTASDADYDHIFIFAHAPLVTSSESHPATQGSPAIRALLESYPVDIFFNGHNHAYERTYGLKGEEFDDQGVVYITVGSGGGLSDGVAGEWFTAFDANDFANYGEPGYDDKMTTYLKIMVDGQAVRGELWSLGVEEAPVDEFSLLSSNASDNPAIGGCRLFPADNMWNTPVDQHALHPSSDAYITSIGGDTALHPDFGTTWNGMDIGIPYDIIPDGQPFVDVSFLYFDETDPLEVTGPVKSYPIPVAPSIEGGSDRHALLLRQDACILYELYDLEKDAQGQWTAGSGAIWHLDQNEIRPAGYTSADAAGLAILPGLVRYEEVFGDSANQVAPGIQHALRITLSSIQSGYVLPASHSDGSAGDNPDCAPMGLRLRLKAGFDIRGFDEPIQVILRAMQTYGVVVADSGSDMFLSGVHDDRWDDDQLRQLSQVRASDFEAVYTGPIVAYP